MQLSRQKKNNNMNNSEPKTYNLTIYLIKEILEKNENPIDSKTVAKRINFILGNNLEATLHLKQNSEKLPDWAKFLSQSEDIPNEWFDKNRHTGAALEVVVQGKKLVITFGLGFSMVNGNAIERDFGLRVALNATDDAELRSIDKSTNSVTPLNARSQSSLGVDIDSLLIDTESDLLFAVTGKSKVKELGSIVTGRDSLILKPKLRLEELPEILKTVLTLYGKALPSKYQWVDNIRKIKDRKLNDQLFDQLISQLNIDDTANIWIGEPEIIDWSNVDGFQVGNDCSRHDTISLAKILAYLRKSHSTLSIRLLDTTTVYCKAADGAIIKKWSVTRCIYAEILFANETYVLRDGIWYKVDNDFITTINRAVSKIEHYPIKFPEYDHDSEGDYNKYVETLITDAVCMDAKNISYGGGRSKIEFCDLLIKQCDFVHIKRYSGSQPLSHLFNQGYVAAETFKRSEEFRKAVNKKLPSYCQLPILEADINVKQFSVIFAICTDKTSLPIDLPFFSKVALKKASESLRTMGLKVYIAKIPYSATFAVKSKIKSQKNKRQNTAR